MLFWDAWYPPGETFNSEKNKQTIFPLVFCLFDGVRIWTLNCLVLFKPCPGGAYILFLAGKSYDFISRRKKLWRLDNWNPECPDGYYIVSIRAFRMPLYGHHSSALCGLCLFWQITFVGCILIYNKCFVINYRITMLTFPVSTIICWKKKKKTVLKVWASVSSYPTFSC